MNKRIDFSNLGGFPLEQDTLDFMQQSYRNAFGAFAKLCGNKVIVTGVVVAGGNVSSGWIVYNGELIPFIGGSVATDVVITETAVPATFEDTNVYDSYYTKTATCGSSGDFPFSDLVPLLSLQNMWMAGDIKEKYVDNTYIAANFDGSGYGINAETGWRLLSAVYPNSKGKVFINIDPDDIDFDTAGKNGGEKTHVLSVAEMPVHNHTIATSNSSLSNNDGADPARANITGTINSRGSLGASKSIGQTGSGNAHNNLQPYFVILKLIKL